MLKKNILLFSFAAMYLLLVQAAAISENSDAIGNLSVSFKNAESIEFENNESIINENAEITKKENTEAILSENNSSELFSLAPLNPKFESYLENKEPNSESKILFLSELSGEEVEDSLTGLIPAPVDLSHQKGIESPNPGNFPVSYDLRDLGRVSPIRDQMDAGSCWAFGICASLESYLLGKDEQSMDFSENNIKNLLSSDYPEGFDRTQDGGGNPFMTTAYFARWTGPVSETDDPYDSHSGISPTDSPSLKRVQEVIYIPSRRGPEDNALIKWALMKYGVIGSVICYSSDAYDDANSTYYYAGSNSENHLIGIVGWDDSFDRNRFTPAAPGDGAFIVKNSWGTNWGEEGFFYISYYDTVIGSQNTVNTAEDLSSYSHVYQYDPLGWIESMGASGSNTAWAGNVFTAEEAETLEAVSFYTTDGNAEYEIYIYNDPLSGPINPAGAKASVNGTIAFAGYHTVSLESGVPLEQGDRFSVVVKFKTPEYSYPVAVEVPLEEYSSKAKANSGESFFSLDGKSWVDTALAVENMNVCIKAFTNRSKAPEAAFTVNVTSGPNPLTVGFVDASTLSPTTWNWDFGDGNTSTNLFPVHKYSKAGKYNVTLHVENEYGNSTLEKTEWIRVTNNSLLYVDDDGSADFTSIQAAVDAASPGATIIVSNGTYTENVDVGKAVTIVSKSGPEYTEVKAVNPKDSVFYVTADAVNISGFSVSGGSELLSPSSYSTAGIWLYDVRNCNISGNVFSDNFCGIYVVLSGNCTLNGNRAESNHYGIYISSPEGNTLRNNRLENNSYNFAVPRASAENDIDESNTVDGKPIYYLVNERNLVLDSNSDAGTVYCINCQNITARDLNLSENYYGLYLNNTENSHIENVSTSENSYGFYILKSSFLNFTNNYAGLNSYGLYIKDSEWESLSDNKMDGNTYNFGIGGNCTAKDLPDIESSNLLNGKPLYILSGVSDQVLNAGSDAGSVYLLNCMNITVRDLVLQNELYGVYLYETQEAVLKNNTFANNSYGVNLASSRNCTVMENSFSNNSYGISLMSSSENAVRNNTLSENPGYGIYLSESRDNVIDCNRVSGSDTGIQIDCSDNNSFAENTIFDNTLGVYLFDSDYNILTANNASTNSKSGFYLTISQHNILSGNTASKNTRGIDLEGWPGEILASDNILFSNTVSNNSEVGIWLTAAANNTIYSNSFSNTKNVMDKGHNIWNTTIGNYWSDYLGSDADCNGIGDTPYVINPVTEIKDFFPIYKKAEVSKENDNNSNQVEKGSNKGSRSASLGGISGASSVDVLISSVCRQQVIAGQKVEFNFNEPGCSVTGITFVSGTSAGTVTGKVEVLKSMPETVLEGPKGEVYQYMNIVLGSKTFGESGAFKGAVIDFKVPHAWMEENSINEASIVLNRFNNNSWVKLSTEKIREDNDFLYYRAETPGFSLYSITGEKKGIVTITPTETLGSKEEAQNAMGAEVSDATSKEEKESPGFGSVFTAAGILSTLCLLKKRFRR